MYSAHVRSALAASILFLWAACAEPECPDGFDKMGKVCRRHDAGVDAVNAGDSGREGDAAQISAPDSGPQPGGGAIDGSANSSSGIDGGTASVSASDATTTTAPDSGATEVSAECDNSHPCSTGYSCTASKCISACAQKTCDPNATCSLTSGSAVCTCNSGYVAMAGTGNVACTRDVACQELGCSPNAACEVGTDQLRHCTCKNGYTGDGKTCTPVSCPLAATLSIANGSVVTPNGAVYDQAANYACNAGYKLTGVPSRVCGPDGVWSGTTPTCDPRDCGPLTNPSHGRVDTSAGTMIGSPAAKYSCETGYTLVGSATRTCQSSLLGVNWSGANAQCLNCGDGIISSEINEECDPRVPGTNAWTCDSKTCKRSTIYTYCGSAFDCNVGESCGSQALCSVSCSASTPCPPVPAGVPISMSATCLSTGCFTRGCSTNADCAPGLVCYGGTCLPCNVGAYPCPASQTCVVSGGAGYGHCQ
jgi:hypothetical protein